MRPAAAPRNRPFWKTLSDDAMAVLIDLDLTLVDSSRAERLRRGRRWADVYAAIPDFTAYDGVSELLAELVARNVPVCIITSSPRSYCGRVLTHFGWGALETVCYYDTRRHKPHPEPIRAGLAKLGVTAEDAVSVGDDPNDVAASRAAGVYSVGALWGAPDRCALEAAAPDALCETVGELRELLFDRLGVRAKHQR